MPRFLCGPLAIAAIAGCSGEQSTTDAAAQGGVEQISGPFPKTIRGTVG